MRAEQAVAGGGKGIQREFSGEEREKVATALGKIVGRAECRRKSTALEEKGPPHYAEEGEQARMWRKWHRTIGECVGDSARLTPH